MTAPLSRGAATGKRQLRGIKRPGRISLAHRFIGILPGDKCLVPETSTSKPNIREERESSSIAPVSKAMAERGADKQR